MDTAVSAPGDTVGQAPKRPRIKSLFNVFSRRNRDKETRDKENRDQRVLNEENHPSAPLASPPPSESQYEGLTTIPMNMATGPGAVERYVL